ncbi:hypothetical protein B0F90DRAFT_1669355 [Multifurca ochricompacta]|uniref:DUF6697 domain-containing protein n=1 Tax=Multifurca ochricompacta TaxID=376703 RepID=A0AAD4M262_9AGAM|nr:hypothetical protein B0F90DRAFT_1669355 [Multifurca ochricompacta]
MSSMLLFFFLFLFPFLILFSHPTTTTTTTIATTTPPQDPSHLSLSSNSTVSSTSTLQPSSSSNFTSDTQDVARDLQGESQVTVPVTQVVAVPSVQSVEAAPSTVTRRATRNRASWPGGKSAKKRPTVLSTPSRSASSQSQRGSGRSKSYSNIQRTVPATPASSAACTTSQQPYNSLDALFRNAGLKPFILTTAEAARADETPDSYDDFHVLLSITGNSFLNYQGEYARVPLPQSQCRDFWSKRFTSSQLPAMRALRTRIKLRNELMRDPSLVEIQECMGGRQGEPSYSDVIAAFREGEETMWIEGLQCIGYDSNLATIIQRNAGA